MKLTVKDRATLAILMAMALTLLLGLVSWESLKTFRIGGVISRELEHRNDLVQDAAPPPLFFVEAGMHLHQVAVASDPVVRETDWKEYHRHLGEFRTKLAHYDSVFADEPDIRQKLHAMVAPMVAVQGMVDERFAPL